MRVTSWDAAERVRRSLLSLAGATATFLLWIVVAPAWAVVRRAEPSVGRPPRRSRLLRRKNLLRRVGSPGVLQRTDTCADREELVYHFDSLFLRQCLCELTPGPDEELLIISGIRRGRDNVPLLRYKPAYEHSSMGGVAADARSSHATLRFLREHGHACLAMFHSHPGSGPGAVRESGTDIAAQARFEKAGYRVLTGIFARDGHLRLFANTLKFRVQFHGNGIKKVGDGVFKIDVETRQALPLQAARA